MSLESYVKLQVLIYSAMFRHASPDKDQRRKRELRGQLLQAFGHSYNIQPPSPGLVAEKENNKRNRDKERKKIPGSA